MKNISPPTQSVAMPHRLGYPCPKHTKYGLQENVLSGNILCHSNCKLIFITTVEVQIGYNNAEQRRTSLSGEPVHSLWVSLVSCSLNPVTRCLMLGADFQVLTGHGTARHATFGSALNLYIKKNLRNHDNRKQKATSTDTQNLSLFG